MKSTDKKLKRHFSIQEKDSLFSKKIVPESTSLLTKFVVILISSGFIVFIYESSADQNFMFSPHWVTHLITILFIAILVTLISLLFSRKNKRMKESEKTFASNRESLKSANEFLSTLIVQKDRKQIYNFISGFLQKRCPGSVVLIFSVNNPGQIYFETLSGFQSGKFDELYRNSGYQLHEKNHSLSNLQISNLKTGKVFEYNEVLSDWASVDIQIAGFIKNFGEFEKVYGIGITDDDSILAEIIFLTSDNLIANEISFIESLVKQSSIIIQKNIAEVAKSENEEKYKLLFENIPYGFVLYELVYDEFGNPFDFRYLQSNEYFYEFSGLHQNDTINRTLLEVTPNADQTMIRKYIEVAMTGLPFQLEYYSKTYDKHVSVNAYSPRPGQFAALFEDITLRKKIEERQLFTSKILDILNSETDWNNSVKKILSEIKIFSKTDAVSILLKSESGPSYIAKHGFKDDSPDSGYFLCNKFRNISSTTVIDNLKLFECPCGIEITTELEFNEAFFSYKGIWEDTAILEKPKIKSRQDYSDCIHREYKSIALIPIKEGSSLTGLLQLNSKLPEFFSRDYLDFFEEIGNLLGIAYNKIVNTQLLIDSRIKIRSSEEKFIKLFEEDLTGNFIIDSNGLFLAVNKAFLNIFGYSEKQELLGKSIDLLFVDLRDKQKLIKDLSKNKYLKNFERIRKKKNGEIIYTIENVSGTFDEEGKLIEIVGNLFEITDLKNAEKATKESELTARTLLNVNDDINILLDAIDFTIIDINQAGAKKVNLSAENIKGKKINTVISEEKLEVFEQKLIESVNTKLPLHFQQEKSDGRIYFNHIFPITDEHGVVYRLAVYLRDITNLIQLDELRKLNSELIDANSTRDRLFSIIAHDLRSPVSSILSISDFLNENIKENNFELVPEFISHINSSAKQTFNLLENLLAWATIKSGQIEYKPEKLNLRSVITEIAEVLKLSASIKNIELEYSVPENIEVYADSNMLRAVIRNLIQNAIKFTQKDGRVNITAIPGENYVTINVKDTGIGMSREAQKKLFSFSSQHTIVRGTEGEKGSGLGLALSKEFIEKQGGEISVVSKPGTGSKFSFTIPIF